MIVTMLLDEGNPPPFRVLWQGDLPALPAEGELVTFNRVMYSVRERSWLIDTVPEMAPVMGVLNGGPAAPQIAIGILLKSISNLGGSAPLAAA